MRYRKKRNTVRVKSRILKYSAFLFLILLLSVGIGMSLYACVHVFKKGALTKSIYVDWEHGDYDSVYQKTTKILETDPFDAPLLAMHGFAAYYLFTEQTDLSFGANYLTDSVVYLRRALYYAQESLRAKIVYILGKAYYQQGYYYSDLALRYLDEAYERGLRADDLAEFRGMAASLLGDSKKALVAFTEALQNDPSDFILFAVADNYEKSGNIKNAQLYLFETIKKTKNAVLELRCRNRLGFLFIAENKFSQALEQFNTVLAKDRKSADAYYGIGLVYELQGDSIKARYEWRKGIKVNPLHAKMRAKLHMK